LDRKRPGRGERRVRLRSEPGPTFADPAALGEDDGLLAEILFNPHSLPQLEKITQKLEFLKHIIAARDDEEARRLFARLRDNLERR